MATILRDASGDRIVVESDDSVLADLGFVLEHGRYVRRFPSGSMTDVVLARFQEHLPAMTRQAARLEPTPWEDALRETARRLNGGGIDWWLTGSAALAVRGLPVSPRDLDLVVSDADAHRVATLFGDVLIEPAVAVEDWFCRWWGRAWLDARVEWVGGVTDAADRPQPTDFGPTAAAALCEVKWEGATIRVPTLELQRAVSVRRGLAERVRLIDSL